MSRYSFDLATPADDADLRHVLAATPMPGRVAVGFRREPSWFDAAVVDGFERQVVACRDATTGRIIGFGCRSLRRAFVNGRPSVVGYLSSLRVLSEHRNLGLIARGYAFFRKLHEDGRSPFYLTTIAEGNETALRVLTSGRAGLPLYHSAGRYHTLAIPLPRRAGGIRQAGVRPADESDLPALLAFLAEEGPRRQFFPCCRPDDWSQAYRGLEPGRILLAMRGGRIAGALGGWDQHAYRQSVVHGYGGALRWLRPVYNLWAGCTGRPALPRPGGAFRYLTAAFPTAASREVFAELLGAAQERFAGGPWSHLLIGLHESDPVYEVAARRAAARYVTLLYLVCWQDGDAARLALDERPPYLEAGSL